MDKRISSSSAPGYIIIAGLADSTYTFALGFPRNEWPEQNVTLSVKESDAGYILKNLPGKGWGLQNLQTSQVLMPLKNAENREDIESKDSGDAFSMILAAVVNDPSIARRLTLKTDIQPVERSKEQKIEEGSVKEVKTFPGKVEIIRFRYEVNEEGVNITYLDQVNEGIDTIRLFIPLVRSNELEEPEKEKERLKPVKANTGETRFIDMELQNPNSKPDSAAMAALSRNAEDSTGKKIKGIKKNSVCRNTASYDDFVNLRKLMAAELDYKDMIKVAGKKFKVNCYTTEQIKNLGSMFLTDEGKYKFYVAAYPFVSDAQNFVALEHDLIDTIFIKKFKAILRN